MRPPPILPPVERRPRRRRRSFLLSFLGFSFASGVVLFLAGAAVGGYFLWQATSDLPSYETERTQTPSPLNPLGAKGIGESGAIGSTPAIWNAVVDAVSHLGVKNIDMPALPERVWQAIEEAKAGAPA